MKASKFSEAQKEFSLPKVDWLLGDRGYDADCFRESLKDKGIRACIPGRKQRKKPVQYDKRRPALTTDRSMHPGRSQTKAAVTTGRIRSTDPQSRIRAADLICANQLDWDGPVTEVLTLSRGHFWMEVDLRADVYTGVEVDDMLIGQAGTAIRYGAAYGVRRIGAMDPQVSVASISIVEIKCPRTERVVWPTRDTACKLGIAFGIATDHGIRRPPPRPFRLACYCKSAGLVKVRATDPDTMADGQSAIQHEIEVKVVRRDVDIANQPIWPIGIDELRQEAFGQGDGMRQAAGCAEDCGCANASDEGAAGHV